jgi:hypothetical protein
MNKTLTKWLLLFCLSGFLSSQLLIFGAIKRADMLPVLIVFFAFGSICLRLVDFVDWLEKKRRVER